MKTTIVCLLFSFLICNVFGADSLSNGRLSSGEKLVSVNNQFELRMQSDGNLNLVRLRDAVSRWSSGTNGNNGAFLQVQSDGNMVIYNAASQPIKNFATSTPNVPVKLWMQVKKIFYIDKKPRYTLDFYKTCFFFMFNDRRGRLLL
jgi:hypothetical protein